MRATLTLPIISGLFVFVSCGADNQPVEEQAEEKDTAALQEPFVDEVTLGAAALDSVLATFPKHWVEIESRGKDLVYIEYCGMEHPYLRIDKKEDHWEIFTAYGQDGEEWEIIDMKMSEQLVEGQVLCDGQFIVKKITYPDDETYYSAFFWNKTSNICTFSDFFNPEKMFTDNALEATFVVEEEECDY